MCVAKYETSKQAWRFHTRFSAGGLRGQQLKENSKYLAIFSKLWQFCWLHTKTGPIKVVDVTMPHGSRSISEPLSRGVQATT